MAGLAKRNTMRITYGILNTLSKRLKCVWSILIILPNSKYLNSYGTHNWHENHHIKCFMSSFDDETFETGGHFRCIKTCHISRLVAHVAMAPTFYVQVQDSPKRDGNWLLNFPDCWTMFYRDASAVLCSTKFKETTLFLLSNFPFLPNLSVITMIIQITITSKALRKLPPW